jgi:hypothetical protein
VVKPGGVKVDAVDMVDPSAIGSLKTCASIKAASVLRTGSCRCKLAALGVSACGKPGTCRSSWSGRVGATPEHVTCYHCEAVDLYIAYNVRKAEALDMVLLDYYLFDDQKGCLLSKARLVLAYVTYVEVTFFRRTHCNLGLQGLRGLD